MVSNQQPPPSLQTGVRDPDSENSDLRLYRKHYAGLTRGQLQQRNPALYERLRYAGLLDRIPLKQYRVIPDPLAYYREHYKGVTRGQRQMRDSGLYHRLRKAGLLVHVPKKKDLTFSSGGGSTTAS